MKSGTHIILTTVLLLCLIKLINISINPVLIMLILVSSVMPDIDVMFGAGFKYHRKGTHTIMASVLYALGVVVLFRILTLYLPNQAVIFGLMGTILLIEYIYNKGNYKKALNSCIWTMSIVLILVYDISSAPNNYTFSVVEVFICALVGYNFHFVGDLISASGGTKFKILYPLSKPFGVRVIKTGGLSEVVLYFVCMMIFLMTSFTQGKIFSQLIYLINIDYLGFFLALILSGVSSYSVYTPIRQELPLAKLQNKKTPPNNYKNKE